MAENVEKKKEPEKGGLPPNLVALPPASTDERQHPTKNNSLVGIFIASGVAILLVGAGGGMLAGYALAHHTMASSRQSRTGQQALQYEQRQNSSLPGQSFSPRRLGGLRGSVTAISATSISVKSATTGVVSTYVINDVTKITKNGVAATVSDITNGSMVQVREASGESGVAGVVRIE